MNFKVQGAISHYNDLWNGYYMLLTFRYCNLCVKAEPVSLIPVEVEIEGYRAKLEDVADISNPQDDQFQLFPKIDDILVNISKAITDVHPEFKQQQKKEVVSGKEEQTILLTMPQVNDDRYDLLKKMVDNQYNDAKQNIDKTYSDARTKVPQILQKEPADAQDDAKKKLKENYDKFIQMIDKAKQEKMDQIEQAHQKWQTEQAEKDAQGAQQEQAASVGQSFDFSALQK